MTKKMEFQIICAGCIQEGDCKRDIEKVVSCLDTRVEYIRHCEEHIISIKHRIEYLKIGLEIIAKKNGVNLEFEIKNNIRKGV